MTVLSKGRFSPLPNCTLRRDTRRGWLQIRPFIDRINARDSPEFDKDISDMPLDGCFCKTQTRGYLAIAERLPHKTKYFTFTRGKNSRRRYLLDLPQALPRNSEHDPVSVSVNRPDRDHEFLPVDAFEQIAPNASGQQVLNELGTLVHAQYDYLRPGRTILDLSYRGGDIPAWNLNVEQHYIRVFLGSKSHRGRAVTSLADYAHIVLRLEDPAQTLADKRVVVDDQDCRAISRIVHRVVPAMI